MTESQTVSYVDSLDRAEKAKVYMNYYVNMIFVKYTHPNHKNILTDVCRIKTYEEFTDKNNVRKNISGEREWLVLQPLSIYNYVYHSIK